MVARTPTIELARQRQIQVRRPRKSRPVARAIGAGLVVVLFSSCAQSYGEDIAPRSSDTMSPAVAIEVSPCAPSPGPVDIPQPSAEEVAAAGLDQFPVAPLDNRVDLVAPPFSDPTDVTNPLFPISQLHSAILNGTVDGKPIKIETTLLPEKRIIEYSPGLCIETDVSQFVAYSDGRIVEVALDLYAQADDGSVWYLGEDVFNYEDGSVIDLSGTWFAGREGPAALIMPANPQLGDAYRPENIPGLVFEEVTVKEVNLTVDGPHGPVQGAMVGEELHDNGTLEEKIFAPGYGEFFTGDGTNFEAMALAVPTDALPGSPPDDLLSFTNAVDDIFKAVRSKEWKAAAATTKGMASSWNAYLQSGEAAVRLKAPGNRALKALEVAIENHKTTKALQAAIAASDAGLDLQLQYRPVDDIDMARLDLWARQVIVDAGTKDLGKVTGDVAVLEWIRDRIPDSLTAVDVVRIDRQLDELRDKVGDGDFGAAAKSAAGLRDILAGLGVVNG
jgi:hypothetical protein